jgi:hypothetical protein
MGRKVEKLEKTADWPADEHERLEQEDFRWLSEFRDILSPYWSSRVEYQSDAGTHVLVLEGSGQNHR